MGKNSAGGHQHAKKRKRGQSKKTGGETLVRENPAEVTRSDCSPWRFVTLAKPLKRGALGEEQNKGTTGGATLVPKATARAERRREGKGTRPSSNVPGSKGKTT